MGPNEPATKVGARGQNLQLGTSLPCPPGSETRSRDRTCSTGPDTAAFCGSLRAQATTGPAEGARSRAPLSAAPSARWQSCKYSPKIRKRCPGRGCGRGEASLPLGARRKAPRSTTPTPAAFSPGEKKIILLNKSTRRGLAKFRKSALQIQQRL